CTRAGIQPQPDEGDFDYW
nr:immunoglobulin heavy chain junction region [Macaca mulatta]MOX65718.1 immunoglobulin heavy chain junction region [Macaca mulatta]